MLEYLRLFVAAELSPAVRTRLIELQQQLAVIGADVKWVEPENLHVTLKFLGATSPGMMEDVTDALTGVASRHTPWTITLQGAGAFPFVKNPRVVWAGVRDGGDALRRLAADLERTLVEEGVPPDDREFSAHVTLGRVRSRYKRGDLIHAVADRQEWPVGTMQVESFVLVQSHLSPQGPVYHPVTRFGLRST